MVRAQGSLQRPGGPAGQSDPGSFCLPSFLGAPESPEKYRQKGRSRVSKALKSPNSELRGCQAWECVATLWEHVVLLPKSWSTSFLGRETAPPHIIHFAGADCPYIPLEARGQARSVPHSPDCGPAPATEANLRTADAA